MLPITAILSHSLLYGAILSLLLSALIVATLLRRPMIWINDAPPELRRQWSLGAWRRWCGECLHLTGEEHLSGVNAC